MKRYFFHVQDGQLKPDVTGVECATIETVREHAIRMAASALSTQNGSDWETIDWQITVSDEVGETIFTLNFYGEERR